jgi:hypothetical protein
MNENSCQLCRTLVLGNDFTVAQAPPESASAESARATDNSGASSRNAAE